MDIGILGTGDLAVTLGRAWTGAGHTPVVVGRDPQRARRVAARIGPTATSVAPPDLAERVDVIVVAVAWDGLADALALVGAADGRLAGKTVIDCTNAVDYATGALIPAAGSAAEVVAGIATGAHVVKALHLFAGASWPYDGPPESAPVVAICGDEPTALELTRSLVADLGGRAVVTGGLSSARQLEDAAGFVMRVVAAGANPKFAVPDVEPAAVA